MRQSQFIQTMREFNAEGLMIRPVDGTQPALLSALAATGMPAVQICARVPGAALDAVVSDDQAGVDLAIAHLRRLGHRDIAYVGGANLDPRGQLRLAAFARALAACGSPPPPHRSVVGPQARQEGMLALYELVERDPAVTAILCDSDEVAFGAMLGLINSGRQPGTDMAVVGWNNVAEAALWYPALTTIAHDLRSIGETATRLLIDRISGEDVPPRTVYLRPTLVVRQSCGSDGARP